ncbi:hypothetical protein CF54_19265 [Streptomyces sp. Tu 6176]|nr:hypothetical protein CF54_19265 [Streptomyces sp. Tu 6176]
MTSGRSSYQRKVRCPAPSEVTGPGRPLPTAVQPSGTVAVSRKVALSDGWSFAGYQAEAACGSPTTDTPPSVSGIQPSPTGLPAYRTRTEKGAPLRSRRAGVTTSSCAPSRATARAATPSTVTEETSKPVRSRWKRSRSSRARAVTVVSPSRWSGRAGS